MHWMMSRSGDCQQCHMLLSFQYLIAHLLSNVSAICRLFSDRNEGRKEPHFANAKRENTTPNQVARGTLRTRRQR